MYTPLTCAAVGSLAPRGLHLSGLVCCLQGALTHGDRRATESRDLSKYNFENKVGRSWVCPSGCGVRGCGGTSTEQPRCLYNEHSDGHDLGKNSILPNVLLFFRAVSNVVRSGLLKGQSSGIEQLLKGIVKGFREAS